MKRSGSWWVIDPAGYTHWIKLEGSDWFGTENIAHAFSDGIKAQVKRSVLDNLFKADSGEWNGFRWGKE